MNTSAIRDNHNNKKKGVTFSAPPAGYPLPAGYATLLREIKGRVAQTRLHAILSANSQLIALYWEIGQSILLQQHKKGWGTKVIDRLSYDLVKAFPDMKGFSPRNLKYMRAFAAAWPEKQFVQRVVAQIPWRSNIALLDKSLFDHENPPFWPLISA